MVETIGNLTGSTSWEQSGKEEHAAGEGEYKAAQAKGYAEGAMDRIGGKKDSVVGAITGDKTQQADGQSASAYIRLLRVEWLFEQEIFVTTRARFSKTLTAASNFLAAGHTPKIEDIALPIHAAWFPPYFIHVRICIIYKHARYLPIVTYMNFDG